MACATRLEKYPGLFPEGAVLSSDGFVYIGGNASWIDKYTWSDFDYVDSIAAPSGWDFAPYWSIAIDEDDNLYWLEDREGFIYEQRLVKYAADTTRTILNVDTTNGDPAANLSYNPVDGKLYSVGYHTEGGGTTNAMRRFSTTGTKEVLYSLTNAEALVINQNPAVTPDGAVWTHRVSTAPRGLRRTALDGSSTTESTCNPEGIVGTPDNGVAFWDDTALVVREATSALVLSNTTCTWPSTWMHSVFWSIDMMTLYFWDQGYGDIFAYTVTPPVPRFCVG